MTGYIRRLSMAQWSPFGPDVQSTCLEQPSIIALKGTWLTPDVSDADTSIDGYSIFPADPKRGGLMGLLCTHMWSYQSRLCPLIPLLYPFAMHPGFKSRCVGPILSFSVWSTVASRVPRKTTNPSYEPFGNSPPTTIQRISCW
ncbi:hypothetical protein T265_02747 [Opisthorchis viverrini]|uniref:Uncharacterized protein n=1 Tax=Opisthorchis viverrini TaxID=6198 RepID=A0A075A5N4_OPIVI|nr:hypothetical protein T265_02747 [Opisthorchis viverrini]KER30935.1 hypothetical protein T265_02747 [Opisthorchis viverrini]